MDKLESYAVKAIKDARDEGTLTAEVVADKIEKLDRLEQIIKDFDASIARTNKIGNVDLSSIEADLEGAKASVFDWDRKMDEAVARERAIYQSATAAFFGAATVAMTASTGGITAGAILPAVTKLLKELEPLIR